MLFSEINDWKKYLFSKSFPYAAEFNIVFFLNIASKYLNIASKYCNVILQLKIDLASSWNGNLSTQCILSLSSPWALEWVWEMSFYLKPKW